MDFRTFALVADNHGEEEHEPTSEKFFDWLERAKPQIRVHLGDAINFAALRNGASDKDKAASLAEDVRMGRRFLKRFFKGGEENVFLRGNHDERLWRLQQETTNAVARGYAEEMTAKLEADMRAWRVKMLPYDARKGVYHLGQLKCLHGYAHGVGAVRAHARAYGECVFGHIHRFDSAGIPALENRFARSLGCLARHDMAYCSTQLNTLGWHHGWGYGVLFSDGSYILLEAKADPQGRIVVADSFRQL